MYKKITFEELMKSVSFSSAFNSLPEEQKQTVKENIEKIITGFNDKILLPISELRR